jgi:hypothetical protein
MLLLFFQFQFPLLYAFNASSILCNTWTTIANKYFVGTPGTGFNLLLLSDDFFIKLSSVLSPVYVLYEVLSDYFVRHYSVLILFKN